MEWQVPDLSEHVEKQEIEVPAGRVSLPVK